MKRIAIGVGGLVVITAAVLIAVALLRSSPYDSMVKRLYPNMPVEALKEELGEPYKEFDFWEGRAGWVYRVEGTNRPLIIQFVEQSPPQRVDRWCIYVPGSESNTTEALVFVPKDRAQPNGPATLNEEIEIGGKLGVKFVCNKVK